MKVIKIPREKKEVEKFVIPRKRKDLKKYACGLRKRATKSEKALKGLLKRRRYNFRFQHVLCGYILDFYFPDQNYAVEIDGYWHKRNPERDERRDKRLRSVGIKTLRMDSDIVEAHPGFALKQVESTLKLRRPKRKKHKRIRERRPDALLTEFMFVTEGI